LQFAVVQTAAASAVLAWATAVDYVDRGAAWKNAFARTRARVYYAEIAAADG
jgi:hypothetical protein